MKTLKLLPALIIVLAMTLSVTAKDYINNPDKKIPMTPEVTQGELPNGMKYFIRENAKPENRAELQIVIKAGSVHEDDDQQGLAHFIEHMCFNGTENFPKNDLIKFLESTGMRFGGDVNANTGFDRTYYMLTIPMDKEGLLEKGFQVLEDWLQNVSFDQEELDKERGVIIEEWRSRNNASSRAFEAHFDEIAAGSKYYKRYPIGDTAIIKNAPRDVFVRYYEDWYRPNLSAVIAVGDFDKNEIEKMIKERFGKLKNPANPRKMEEYKIPVKQQSDVSIYTEKELTFPMIQVYLKHQQDEKILGTYKEYRKNVTNTFINQMLNTRIGELTQKADAPYVQAGAGYSTFSAGLMYFPL
jgi:zinc protease